MFGTFLILVLLPTALPRAQPSYLSGKHFRIAHFESPFETFTEVNAQNATVLRGFFIDMLQWMSVRHNFTYTPVLTEVTKFANLPAVFSSKKVDWVAVNYAIGHGKNYIAQHTFPFTFITYSAIIPYPKPEVNVYSVVLPYDTEVWVCFFVSMVVVSILLRCFAHSKKYIYQHKMHDSFLCYKGTIFYVVGVATNQGATCFSKACTVRLLAGIWCLAALVLVNAFSGSLITHIMAPRFKPLIKSIRDIFNKSEPQILAPATNLFQTIVESSPTYQPLRDNVLQVPGNFCGIDLVDQTRNDQCLALVKRGGHVFVTDKDVAELYVQRDFRKTGSCTITLAEEEIPITNGGWALPLNSPHELRNDLDVLLLKMISYGLEYHWRMTSSETPRFCKGYKHVNRSLRKLSLTDVASAFIVLGAGIVISVTVLTYEVLKGHLLPRHRKTARKPLDQANWKQ